MSIQEKVTLTPDNHEITDFSTDLASGDWEPKYGDYDRELQLRKLSDLYKRLLPVVSDKEELEELTGQTAEFMQSAFNLFEGRTEETHEGSYAFVVPTRIERDNHEYGEEATSHFPILKYVDPATRQRMLVGMCPFIIDRYGVDENGKRGYMVFSPLFGDMMSDLKDDPLKLMTVASAVINDTAKFARDRLGASVVGLGAILPRLTNMGRDVVVPGLHTTTGHGGTVHLIAETMKLAIDKRMIANYSGRLGIIGAGAIGSATADVILSRAIADELVISDNQAPRLQTVVAQLQQKYPSARILGTLNNAEVFAGNNGVVSAVTTSFDLDGKEWSDVDLDGKFVLDDSQPGCFNPEKLEARGATLAWVMGRDETKAGLSTLESFDYGSTGPASRKDVWGCQGEAAAIATTQRYDYAIRDIVTPQDANQIGEIFEQTKIGPAPLQRMGKYITTQAFEA